ncbi:MAG: translation initiation factor IF-5A [Candidatus Aenigmarchaeota archaeon]|nr:translation initiation factor IF-5A [Candidatus Aenigmarchaeota archaeon]
MEKTTADVSQIKEGGFIIIDDAPCKISKITRSTSGKHGAAKYRIDGTGLLDNKHRSLVLPSGETVGVPIMLKKKAQVLSVAGNKAQLMDMETYEQLELDIPEERKNEVVAGNDVDYFEIMDVKTLKQLK